MDDVEKFLRHINLAGCCWLWTGSRVEKGGGLFPIMWQDGRGDYISVRKFSLITNGKKPPTRITTTCGNDLCVNPEHLVRGTRPSNAGERHPMAKLSQKQVLKIKAAIDLGIEHAVIASSIGVSRATISAIAAGINWGDEKRRRIRYKGGG